MLAENVKNRHVVVIEKAEVSAFLLDKDVEHLLRGVLGPVMLLPEGPTLLVCIQDR